MNTPIFSRIASHIRSSSVPADTKNDLLLLFFRLKASDQISILNCLETSKEALPLFMELLTEMEQNNIKFSDLETVEKMLQKYLEKVSA